MKISDWKNLTNEERSAALADLNSFNPYSDEAYELVRALGYELAEVRAVSDAKIGVLNRFGELIINLSVPDHLLEQCVEVLDKEYFGFRVFTCKLSARLEH